MFRTWVTVAFLWSPIILALLLNPGRNGNNIASFSLGSLLLLTLCGLMLSAYGLVGYFQPRVLSFVFTSAPMTTSRVFVMVFAFLLGAISVYQGCLGLAAAGL
jgi:hypothetical protein